MEAGLIILLSKYNNIHLSNIHGNWRDSDIDYLEE